MTFTLDLEKYRDAVSIYGNGLSVEECANHYGVTRQCMYDVLKRRGCVFRTRLGTGPGNHFYRGIPSDRSKKESCHNAVENAIKRGELIRAASCSECGSPDYITTKRTHYIHAHHDDYDKPISVRWLCGSCHYKWHKKNKAINEI